MKCALPAINVVNSTGVTAALAAAAKVNSPIIIQVSMGGLEYFAGPQLKGVVEDKHRRRQVGGIVLAETVRNLSLAYGVSVILHTDHAERVDLPTLSLLANRSNRDIVLLSGDQMAFSSHMLDLSTEPLKEILETADIWSRILHGNEQYLEVEVGPTGGEEDGKDNSGISADKLYTSPEDVFALYNTLAQTGYDYFTIAAAFGNVHGVYQPGNVKLKPEILAACQKHAAEELGISLDSRPIDFVFHGGSGSTLEEIHEAIEYGVVKMNIDTDTQFAWTRQVVKYVEANTAYLQTQIGNPEGDDKPNKSKYDPRKLLSAGELGMTDRIVEAFAALKSTDVNTLFG